MQQKAIRRFAIAVGGGLLAVTGIVVAACSTDNGSSSGTPGFDAGRDTKGGSDNDVPPPDDSGSSGGDGGDGGVKCPAPPNKDHPPGPYCFNATDAGGCNRAADETCCSDGRYPDGGFSQAQCLKEATGCAAAFVGTVDGGLQWNCTEASHCDQGERCCVIAGFGGTPKALSNNDFPGCKAYYNNATKADGPGKFVGGTRCRANECQAGELTLCSKDADCKAGTCYPIELYNRFTGVCIVGN